MFPPKSLIGPLFSSPKNRGVGITWPLESFLPPCDARKQLIAVFRKSVTAPGDKIGKPQTIV
jgi:hypothetical protein